MNSFDALSSVELDVDERYAGSSSSFVMDLAVHITVVSGWFKILKVSVTLMEHSGFRMKKCRPFFFKKCKLCHPFYDAYGLCIVYHVKLGARNTYL